MTDPVLHLLAGPIGAGKSTLHEHVVGPVTRLEFVDADLIATQRWPDDAAARSYDAARAAAERRGQLIRSDGRSSPRPCSRTTRSWTSSAPPPAPATS